MENILCTEPKNRPSKREYWSRHIENWQQSELTQVEYCRKNDLNKHTFHYWKAKQNKTDRIRPLLPVSILGETFSANSSLSSGISISISNRFNVNIDIGFDSETLSRLMDLLERM